VKDLAHLVGPEEDISALLVGDHKAVALGMALHRTADEIRLGRQQVGATPVAHNLPVTLHCEHATFKELHLYRLDVQGGREIGKRHGDAAVCQRLDDELPTGQGKIVLLGLPLEEGITATQLAKFFCVFGF